MFKRFAKVLEYLLSQGSVDIVVDSSFYRYKVYREILDNVISHCESCGQLVVDSTDISQVLSSFDEFVRDFSDDQENDLEDIQALRFGSRLERISGDVDAFRWVIKSSARNEVRFITNMPDYLENMHVYHPDRSIVVLVSNDDRLHDYYHSYIDSNMGNITILKVLDDTEMNILSYLGRLIERSSHEDN